MSLEEKDWKYALKAHGIQRIIPDDAKRGIILDLGCGDGSLAVTVFGKESVERVVGVDISPNALKKAKKRIGSLVLGDATYLPFRDLIFDGVICSAVIAHLTRDQAIAALIEVHRVLTDEGFLVLLTVNREPLKEKIMRKTKKIHCKEHIYEYSYKELKGLVENFFYITKKLGVHLNVLYSLQKHLIKYKLFFLSY